MSNKLNSIKQKVIGLLPKFGVIKTDPQERIKLLKSLKELQEEVEDLEYKDNIDYCSNVGELKKCLKQLLNKKLPIIINNHYINLYTFCHGKFKYRVDPSGCILLYDCCGYFGDKPHLSKTDVGGLINHTKLCCGYDYYYIDEYAGIGQIKGYPEYFKTAPSGKKYKKITLSEKHYDDVVMDENEPFTADILIKLLNKFKIHDDSDIVLRHGYDRIRVKVVEKHNCIEFQYKEYVK